MARIFTSWFVCNARTKPVTELLIKPNLRPCWASARPLAALPTSCPAAVTTVAGGNPAAAFIAAPLPRTVAMCCAAESGEVDPQFQVFVEFDADDDRFDQHLRRLHVELRDHPVDRFKHALAILHDEHVGRRRASRRRPCSHRF